MRRPDGLALCDAEEILFRDGACPAVAVFLLAALQNIDHIIGLRLDRAVAGGSIVHGGGRQPVPGEVSAQLAAGVFPAAVHIFRGFRRASQTGFQFKIQHQRAGFQTQHIVPVFPFTALQFGIVKADTVPLDHLQ